MKMSLVFFCSLSISLFLQMYFIGWRKQKLKEGMPSNELNEYWNGQRRVYVSGYIFGCVGLLALFLGATWWGALGLALTVTIIAMLVMTPQK